MHEAVVGRLAFHGDGESVHDLFYLHRSALGDDVGGEMAGDGLGVVVYVKLTIHQHLQLLEQFRNRPVREGVGEVQQVPCIWQHIAAD